MIDLEGKSAVITGSSRGIGRACAKRLAGLGADVMINHSSDSSRKQAEDLADELNSLEGSGSASVKQADISQKVQADELIDSALHEFERIDILVNNAGINRDNLLLRMDEDEWQDVIDVNLTGVFNCTKSVIRPMMKARGGRIINMTSVVAIMGNPGQTNYCAAKAGVIGFTKSIAREVASRNITINAVAPGFISTEMTESMPEDAREKMLENIPLQRVGKPEEVADTVAFLASEQAQYITGEVIKVAGGLGI